MTMRTATPGRHLTVRRAVTVAALTAAWCALWQRFSFANVVSGLVIAVVVTSLGIGTAGRGRVRIRPLLRLTWLVLVDLVVSTVGVAQEVLTPTDRTDEAIIAIDIPADARQHFLVLVVAITLTPGTAVVDADPDTGTLYLHLLHHQRRAEVTAHVHRLAALVDEALPATTRRTTQGVMQA